MLHDEIGFDATTLPLVCYQMCHSYARCARSVSLVPVVYYAHLVAARGRVHQDGAGLGESESDTASVASGSRAGGGAAGPPNGLLGVHPTAYSNGMYYV